MIFVRKNKKAEIFQELKNYISDFDTISIVGEINNKLNHHFKLPLKVQDYYFFNTNGLVGIDMNCYLENNGEIIMENYSIVVHFNIYKK